MKQKILIYTFLLVWVSVFSQSDSVTSYVDSFDLQPKLIDEEITKVKSSEFYTVKKIELQGTNRNKSAVLIRSGLAEGDKIKIPSEVTRDAIRKLWESNLFSDVKLYVKKIYILVMR